MRQSRTLRSVGGGASNRPVYPTKSTWLSRQSAKNHILNRCLDVVVHYRASSLFVMLEGAAWISARISGVDELLKKLPSG